MNTGGEQRRDLDPREVDQVRIGVFDTDRQVQRQVRDVRERVARIDREGVSTGKIRVLNIGLQHSRLARIELRPAQDADPFCSEAVPAPGRAPPAGRQ